MTELRKVDNFATTAERLATQVGELARDMLAALLKRPRMELVTLTADWEEPFNLSVGDSPSAPDAVLMLRATNNDGGSDGKPGGLAWTWTDGQVQIDDVDNVTVGTNYTMTFLVVRNG